MRAFPARIRRCADKRFEQLVGRLMPLGELHRESAVIHRARQTGRRFARVEDDRRGAEFFFVERGDEKVEQRIARARQRRRPLAAEVAGHV